MRKKQQSNDLSTSATTTAAEPISQAVLDLKGATCTSCAIAIEHLGKRLAQVNDIHVDRSTSTIHVLFAGDDAVLTQLCDFVSKLGYQAFVREVSPAGNNTNQ